MTISFPADNVHKFHDICKNQNNTAFDVKQMNYALRVKFTLKDIPCLRIISK